MQQPHTYLSRKLRGALEPASLTDAEVVAALPREAGGDGRARGGAVEAPVIVKVGTYALPQRRLDLVFLSQRDDGRSLHLTYVDVFTVWECHAGRA